MSEPVSDLSKVLKGSEEEICLDDAQKQRLISPKDSSYYVDKQVIKHIEVEKNFKMLYWQFFSRMILILPLLNAITYIHTGP